jgi:predicted nucleic acid-binding protein
MGAVVLDACVLIGLLDAADAHHERAVADVERADLDGYELIAPASAYSEVLVAFARVGRVREARASLEAMGIVVESLTAEVAENAATLRAKHGTLRLPDAMVLAVSESADRTLLTYDARLRAIAGHPATGE